MGVPKPLFRTGVEISSAMFNNLEKWLLLNKAQRFDTAASNTRRLNEVCNLLANG